MAKKIIYLHIPKVGGTSQRAMFNELYGLDRVHSLVLPRLFDSGLHWKPKLYYDPRAG